MTSHRKVLALLSSSHAVIHMIMGIMAVTMPTIVRELGASFTQVGIMRGAQALSAGAGSVAGGLATDLIGKRKQLLVLSLLWPTVFVFLGGFSPSFFYFALFMVVRELLGGFLWHPPAMATIAEMFPGRKAFGFSLHEAGANIGSSVAPLVTGFLLTYISWRMIYHGYLIPGLAAGMMIWLFLPSLGRIERKRSQEFVFKEVLKKGIMQNRRFLAVTFACGMRGASENAMLVFFPLYLSYNLGKSTPIIGAILFVMTITATLLGPLLGALSDRVNRRFLITLLMPGAALMIYFLTLVKTLPLLFIVSGLLGVSLFAIRSVMVAFATDLTPAELGGTAVGFIYTFQRIFGALVPLIAGYIADLYSLSQTLYFLAICMVAGALSVHFLARK